MGWPSEREATESALAIDPYFLPALLAKGTWLEGFGPRAAAAAMFANALKVAPPPAQWPAALRAQLEHARDFSTRYSDELDEFPRRTRASSRTCRSSFPKVAATA